VSVQRFADELLQAAKMKEPVYAEIDGKRTLVQEGVDWEPLIPQGADNACFYCGDPFTATTPFVMWFGKEALYLHGDCAINLGTHLIKDGFLAREGITNKDFHDFKKSRTKST
jgi:hypothetical protein